MTDETDSEFKQEWYAFFERLGTDVVRERLRGSGSGAGASVRFEEKPGIKETSRSFVEGWLADKERKREKTSRNRFEIIVVIGLLGVLATILAALLGGNSSPN